MGYFRHHAIIVTGQSLKETELAYAKATGMFPVISPFLESVMAGCYSFFIPPDGSKETWPTSNNGDEQRAAFMEYLDSQRYGDGSPMLHWIEVEYGDEDGAEAKILNDSNRYEGEKP